jgi:prepilin signal peptidase PulO-like enzyme (type II secretory pathway)
LALLIALSVIDLKEKILPDKLVAGFAALGLAFHISTSFTYLSLIDMGLGALMGGGLLFAIRTLANKYYGRDTLGLGDVKLLAAAGLWLGPHFILIAMSIGALAGIAHGAGESFYRWRKTGEKPNLGALSVPAGPGFAAGIVITAILQFWIY